MRTRLRNAVTLSDLAELKDIHRRLQMLGVGMNPSAACHPSLVAAIATVRWCGEEWSGQVGWGKECLATANIGEGPASCRDLRASSSAPDV